jgi:hypothetical protein
MKTLAATLLSLGLILFSSNANAWFFFILPGSVTSKIGDALTGSEGENCVGPDAKVGDPITLNGVPMTIKSLSGTSTRCANAAMPIRALLIPTSTGVRENTTEAKIDIPPDWESTALTDSLKANGTVLAAQNKTIDSYLLLNVFQRSHISDMATYVASLRTKQGAKWQEVTQSEISTTIINDLPAWRFSQSGKMNSVRVKFFYTVYEGDKEVVVLSLWTQEQNYERQSDLFLRIADSLTGLRPSIVAIKDAEAKKLAANLEAARASQEDTKRLLAESEARKTAQSKTQIDFNAEALKSSRILGCSALEAKVVGIEKENILYSIACSDSRALQLSCDPAGLCLQKK